MVYHGEKAVIAKNNLSVIDLVLHIPTGKKTRFAQGENNHTGYRQSK